MRGSQRVPNFVLLGKVEGAKLEHQSLDTGRELGVRGGGDDAVGLKVSDDLGQGGPGLLVLLETGDEQEVEVELNVGLDTLLHTVGTDPSVAIWRSKHALFFHVDQQQRDAIEAEGDGLHLVAVDEAHERLLLQIEFGNAEAGVEVIAQEAEDAANHWAPSRAQRN